MSFKAYKGTNQMVCRDQRFEVGQTYEVEGDLILCKHGFHFCRNLADVGGFYNFQDKNNVFLEIEILGDVIDAVDGKKSVTNKLKVLRVIPRSKFGTIRKTFSWDRNRYIDYTYDDNGRILTRKDSEGCSKSRKFDENGNVIYYRKNRFSCHKKYDDKNRIVEYRDSRKVKASVTYKKNGNIASVTVENPENLNNNGIINFYADWEYTGTSM